MIFTSKLIAALILPPGCFIIPLVFLVFFVPRRFKGVLIAVTFFLYALSIQPVSDFLLKPLENAYPPLTNEFNKDWPQAIVVLGAGSIQGSPEVSPKGADALDALSAEAVKRAVHAYSLRGTFSVPIVFSGGKVFDYNQEPEAAAAERLFESLGLPKRRFVAESESRNTWENAKETAKLGYKRVVLVTSAYHMKRSIFCFEKNGMTVIAAPTDYKTARGQKYDTFSFLPSMNSLKNSQIALHEYIGLLYYIIAYTK